MLRPGNARWAAEKSVEAWRDGGVRGLVIKAVGFLEKRRLRAEATPPLPISPGVYRGAVVMLADVEPPQCWHYRVQQKREAFAAKGIPFAVVRPTSSAEVLSTLQLASLLIIYRQPMSMLLREVIIEARRLRIPVVYEADDIVYRQDLVGANPNLVTLPAELRKAVIAGASDYAEGLAVCDGVISSTAPLAEDMAGHLAGGAQVGVAVIENGIDASMWSVSRGIDHDLTSGKIPRGKDGRVVIGYGSGSRAHDADLALAAPALARILAEHTNVSLRLFGPVATPPGLERFHDRIVAGADSAAGGVSVGIRPRGHCPRPAARHSVQPLQEPGEVRRGRLGAVATGGLADGVRQLYRRRPNRLHRRWCVRLA